MVSSKIKFIIAASLSALLFPLSGAVRWAQSDVSALCLRTAPAHSAEMDTQVPFGAPLQVDSVDGDWARVVTADSIVCYAPLKSIVMKTSDEMECWRSAPRVIVTGLDPVLIVADTLQSGVGNVVSDVTLCSILEGGVAPGSAYASVLFPDGRRGYLPAVAVEDFSTWSLRKHSVDEILAAARSMTGVPYLWGGTTSKAVDCSGFTQTCFFYAGCLIPRNSRSQASAGMPMVFEEGVSAGDLLFFGEGEGSRITHVGISVGGSRFLHSSGRVMESSFDPGDPLYIPRRVLSAVRYDISDDFLRVACHPFFFELSSLPE